MQHRWIPLLLSLLLLLLAPGWAPAGFEHRTRTMLDAAPRVGTLPAAVPLADYSFYLPSTAPSDRPVQLLVALHGMGGDGGEFGRVLRPLAERHGFAVLAPTMPYRDYRDPELVRRDGELHPRLRALIESLPGRTGLAFRPRTLFYGFSRGSQEAHRFSFMYPELAAGVAGLSAGSYTLPSKTHIQAAQPQSLPYPYGTADVELICGRAFDAETAKRVSFWIGVGARDVRAEDVPRQWDPYVGVNRVERAQRFVSALQQFGARAELAVYPNAGHEVTEQMREEAFRFLATVAG